MNTEHRSLIALILSAAFFARGRGRDFLNRGGTLGGGKWAWPNHAPFHLLKKARERCEADCGHFSDCDLLVLSFFFATTDALTTIFQFVLVRFFFAFWTSFH